MRELPEAHAIAAQMNTFVQGKQIAAVTAAASPHKFAWYYGDPQEYSGRLCGRTVGVSRTVGSFVEITVEDTTLLIGDGAVLRLHRAGEKRPLKHQLLLEFADGDALSGTIQMYGGFWCFPAGAFDNQYYQVAQQKPSPLADSFDRQYFTGILDDPAAQKLCAKSLLAAEQRIPGLGNGVLQDLLFTAKIHPRQKLTELTPAERDALFTAVKSTLAAMTGQGGRDTETDLFGNPGGYRTVMSRFTVNTPCPACGNLIRKEAFMGGSIYFCPQCQP